MPFNPSKPCNRPMSTKAGIGFVLRLIARAATHDAQPSSPSPTPPLMMLDVPAPLVHACPWRPQRG